MTHRSRKILQHATHPPVQGIVTGKGVGDFGFLAGHWHIRHKKLERQVPKMSGSISTAVRPFTMSLMEWGVLRNCETLMAAIWGWGSVSGFPNWVNGLTIGPVQRTAVVNAPQFGSFIDGEGVFINEEEVDGIKWQYRGVWDQITLESCRWHQSASKDGGKSWKWNWWMEWTRLSAAGEATE